MEEEEKTAKRNLPKQFVEYEERVKQVARTRWMVQIIFVIAVVLILGLPLYTPLAVDAIYVGLLIAVFIFGSILLQYFLNRYPALVVGGMPEAEPMGLKELPLAEVDLDKPWQETTWNIVLLLIIASFFPITPIMFEYPVIFILLTILEVQLLYLFGRQVISCSTDALLIKRGPFVRKIPLKLIESARATSVRRWAEFMGPGKNKGPDGAVGYITEGNTGVRVHCTDGDQYVLSVKNPQSLVDYVRAAKAAEG